jgi:ferredoxin
MAEDEPGTIGTQAVAALRRIRASESAKGFFFSPRQAVAAFPAGQPEAAAGRQILIGVKNCDVVPLRVTEKILGQGEYVDPFFAARKEQSVLVAADCPAPEDSCFCNLPGLTPYVTEGADAVVSVVADSLLFEALTDRGEELAKTGAFKPANDAQLAQRAEQRKAAVAALQKANPQPWGTDLPKKVGGRMADKAFWQKHAADCVECYACLLGCPTCYCYLLYDSARAQGVERTRVWDACYEAAYTRVGGGANPRGEFVKRFANRFECKWKEFRNDHGFFACSGCGRCFRACMGKIDIRKVLAEA